MTATETESAVRTAASDFALDTQSQSFGDIVANYLQRFRTGGDLGLFPAVLALVVLTALFGALRPESFLTKFNLGNFFTQAAPICVLAMGVTFVLLLGEIDLGAGYTAGVSAAVMASQLRDGTPLVLALVLAFGAAAIIGSFNGWMVAKVGIPSFIVTLSGFLAWQGVLLLFTKEGGTIRVENSVIVAIENKNLPVWLGWALWAVLVGGYALASLWKAASRRRQGLRAEPLASILLKTAALAVVWGGFTFVLNQARTETNPLKGVPIVVPLVVGLVILLTYVLTRTAWGRHLYAVGGNAEAARRAGISVTRIRLSAFVVCSLLACAAGIVLASRLNSVDPQTGGNDTLLIAVGAAVIGGTSLFGGRGRIVNAVVGGLVFAVINNGLPLLGELGPIDFSDAGPKFIVNGAVLALFASIDALSRKRAAVS
jgi:D-xylose transport system permease protein